MSEENCLLSFYSFIIKTEVCCNDRTILASVGVTLVYNNILLSVYWYAKRMTSSNYVQTHYFQ